jgi:L-ascorbate metabolism protein UlaG (beta-lactamase superfamily)
MARPLDFSSRLTHPMPTWWDHVRALRSYWRPLGPTARREAAAIPREPPSPIHPLPSDQVGVTWLGHATCVIRMGGLTLLTDPVLSHRVAGVERITPPGVSIAHLGRIDGVLLSHDHADHFDWPTLKQLPRATPIFCGVGLAVRLRRRGFTRVQSLDWWEDETLGPLRLTFVPAHHWSGRSVFDVNRSLWGGWVVEDERGRKVYFAGDTAYGPFFKLIGQKIPGIDVALMPVGAYEPRWYNGSTHTTPEEAVQAVQDLGARKMVPIHWGTFLLGGEPVLEPIERTQAAWDEAGLAHRDLWDLAIGETSLLRERARRRAHARRPHAWKPARLSVVLPARTL